MATSYQQPLLNPSATIKKPTSSKTFLYLFLSLVAIVCPIALLSSYLTTTTHSPLVSLPQICTRAHDPNSCLSLVTPLVEDANEKFNGIELLKNFLNTSISHMENAMSLSNRLVHRVNDMREKAVLADCVDLMDSSIDRALDSISILSKSPSKQNYFDAQTWLSSVLTNHVTCIDELHESSEIKTHLEILIARARTSLAILTTAMASYTEKDDFITRALKGKFPSWVTYSDRKLLLGSDAAATADLVVAQDGSGDFVTINEAVAAAPNNSKVRYTIYIKEGTYVEQVVIAKNKKNLMLVGESKDLTIITGRLNVADNSSTTFMSAPLIVGGEGFIGQELWIQNTAGAIGHQAVALRVSADLTVINRCRIDAYQDSLYTHTLRQFYRDCFITGTVDFIFGNAAVVFQKCQLTPRKPMAGQGNMITAQGRTDPNSNTGISIQNCNIVPSSGLAPVQANFKTYLGRPWKEYSRTVVMQTYIGDVIDPAGWSIWVGDFALSTLYYGEYMNSGPGAGTSERVTWPGYHPALTTSEAEEFTVASLIQGGVWLKSTGVAYTEGL